MPAARRREWGCQIGVEGQDLMERGVEVDLEVEVEVAAETEGEASNEQYCGDRTFRQIRGRN